LVHDNSSVSDSLSPRERRANARELERRMAELDRLDAAYGLGALPRATPSRAARPRGRRLTTAITLAATAVVTAMVVAFHPSTQMTSVRRLVGLSAEDGLLAPPVGGAHKFLQTQPGSDEPVGWDPCQPIRYQVNPEGAPDGGDELIENAAGRISAATGILFKSEGTTDRRPFATRSDLVGTDSPVVIGWGTAEEFDKFDGEAAGLGGSAAAAGVVGRRYYVTGSVALNIDTFTREHLAKQPLILEAIVLHELAHVAGLDHVDDPGELMAPESGNQIELGPGDREGLAQLGSLPCA
jgi:hypothetical protein